MPDDIPDEQWSSLTAAQALEALGSDSETGLSAADALQKLNQYGRNELAGQSGRAWWHILLAQFTSLIIILLLVAAGLALLLGENIEATAILVVIVLNAAIGFATEMRAEQAMTALRDQSVPRAVVVRDGSEQSIPSAELVPGDIVVLAAGDRVPADGRLVESARLQLQESSLTGESQPVTKGTETIDGDVPLAERSNMAHLGSVVTDGRGLLLVTATGMQSEVGKIGTLIAEVEVQDTPLEKRLEQLGRALIGVVAVLTVVIIGAGVLRGNELLYMVEVGISLTIAAVPEGLPAVATMTLALGVQRMSRMNALVRRLPAVETLGSTTVISTDKTGTLTLNEMTVTDLILDSTQVEPDGTDQRVRLALAIGALCNDAEVNAGEVLGDPTEGALIVAAERAGMPHGALEAEYPRVDEIPFESDSKRMVTVHRHADGRLLAFAKGSPAAIVERSAAELTAGGIRPLADPAAIIALNDQLAARALRVLALAYRELPADYTATDLENDLIYVGLVGMIDPLRPEAAAAVQESRQAGIATVMITGDQALTAAAIAGQLGIDRNADGSKARIVHADDLEGLDEAGWRQATQGTGVFARVSPEHKLRIVESLQAQGHIVAMTGDGVNDAPALRQADIGVAMGIKGTAVAKEAADMIIRDDNFATIVRAVEQGRIIYANILRFVQYLFSCNLAEILVMFTAIMLGWPLPLVPLQILWLNIITDVFPALSLAVEPSSGQAMKRPPRDPRQPLLNRSFAMLIVWQAAVVALVTLVAFWWGMNTYGAAADGARHAVTISFMTLALAQVFHAFNARSRTGSAFNRRMFANPWLWAAVLLCIGLQFAAVYVPLLQTVLSTVPLNGGDWLVVGTLSLAVIPIVELVKAVQRGMAARAVQAA